MSTYDSIYERRPCDLSYRGLSFLLSMYIYSLLQAAGCGLLPQLGFRPSFLSDRGHLFLYGHRHLLPSHVLVLGFLRLRNGHVFLDLLTDLLYAELYCQHVLPPNGKH